MTAKYKVLNLYAGIGGNRKLWKNVEVTAVEINPEIAEIYRDFFPGDKLIVADAHEYLLKYIRNSIASGVWEFDLVWGSPPCPSHSKLNTFAVPNGIKDLEYPDFKLYEEIFLLKHWCKSNYVIENVVPYYKPFILGKLIDRHLFWSNFFIPDFTIQNPKLAHKEAEAKYLQEFLGFDLSGYKVEDKRKLLRNCVHPETGLHILNCARNHLEPIQEGLFSNDS